MYTSVTVIGTVTKVGNIKSITNRNGEPNEVITFFIEADNRRGGVSSVVTVCATAWAKLAQFVNRNVRVGSVIIVDGELSSPKQFGESQTSFTCMVARQVTFLQTVRPNRQPDVVPQSTGKDLQIPQDINDIF